MKKKLNFQLGRTTLACLLSACLLAGCVSLGPLPDKSMPVLGDWARRGSVENALGTDPATWWGAFNDPVLDTLVAQTLAQNLSIKQSTYRLQAARALILPAFAQGRPQINAGVTARREQRLSGTGNLGTEGGEQRGGNANSADNTSLLRAEPRASGYYQMGFDAAWEMDLFGRVAASGEAARSAAGVALADARIARVSVVAEVVRTYIELRGAQRRHVLLTENVHDQEHMVAMVLERQKSGIASDFENDRLVAGAAEMMAQLQLLEQLVRQAAQRIAILTGQAASDERLPDVMPQPTAERLTLRLLPADVVRVRPEIQRAEHAVTQAGAELGIAVADMYPRLTLVGDLLASRNWIGTPLPGRSTNASLAMSVNIPLLDWGARRGVVNAREAALAEAIAGYQEAVLEGIEETENALTAIETGRRRAVQDARRLEAAQRSKANAQLLYERGVVNMTELLDATIALRQAQMSSAELTEQRALAVVALHKAVGGASLDPAHRMDTRARTRALDAS